MKTKLRGSISLVLTIVAVFLLIYGAMNAHFEVGDFGLIHGLPPTFLVGLSILAIASVILWTSEEGHYLLAGTQVFILVSALWLIPIFTGGTPPFTDHAYRNLGVTNLAMNYGFRPEGYLKHPGVFILTAWFSRIINIGAIIRYIPFITQVCCLVPLYIFLKNSLERSRWNYCFVGLWLFFLARWIGASQLSPVSLAFFLLLVLLAIMSMPSVGKATRRGYMLFGLIAVVFAMIAVTHLPTSIVALCILGAVSLVRKNKRLILVSSICLLCIVGWDLGYSGYMAEQLGVSIKDATVETGEFISEDPGSVDEVSPSEISPSEVSQVGSMFFSISGSEPHIMVSKIRLAFSAVFVLIGIMGVIVTCRSKASIAKVGPFLAIAIAPLLMLPLARFYDTLVDERIYMYCLLGMAYFGARILDIGKKRLMYSILCFALIAGILFHIISAYGNQTVDYISDDHADGIQYGWDELGLYSELYVYPMGGRFTIERIQAGGPAAYVWLTSQDREWCRFILGDESVFDKCLSRMDNNLDYKLMFSNPDFRLYKRIAE